MTTASAQHGPDRLLDSALRLDPARPLLTFYDDATGERTELSVVTFATWVAKTANLLRDDLDAQPGGTVSVDLPLHWQAAVWLQACWTVGLHVVPPDGAAPPEVAVIGYDGSAPAGAGEVVALGLGPMALPRAGAGPPAGALDFDREVPGHGDRFVPTARPDPRAPAYTDAAGTLSGADLVAAAGSQPALEDGSRLLVTEPFRTRAVVLGGLLLPLATGVTAVLCRDLDAGRLSGRVAQEGLVAAVGSRVPGLPGWLPAGTEDLGG